jgi:Ribbon-helix-helix protein, copG family
MERPFTVQIRLSKEEQKMIERIAKKRGLSKSDAIRQLIREREIALEQETH